MIFSFCIMIDRRYVAYLQLMGGNLFLRKRAAHLTSFTRNWHKHLTGHNGRKKRWKFLKEQF